MFKKLLGDPNTRKLKRYVPLVSDVNIFEEDLLAFSDEDLRNRLVSQGLESPEKRDSITWDDANLFFLSCIHLTPVGQPMPLEAGLSRERFGRFPYGDGSPISYLRDWIRDSRRKPDTLEVLSELMDKLATRMSGTSMESGFGRLEMRGWLTAEEVTSLRKALTSKCWMPSADEPLDAAETISYLRLDSGVDTTLVDNLIKAARFWCEDYINRTLLTTTFTLSLDAIGQIDVPLKEVSLNDQKKI